MTSWHGKVKEYKSPIRVLAAVLLRSRETQRSKAKDLEQQNAELRAQVARQQEQIEQQQREIEELAGRAAKAQKQLDEARQSVNLPDDPPIGTHGYGARMISLAVNLARSVGLRGAVRVLRVFFRWLGIDRAIPSRTSRYEPGCSGWGSTR